MRTASHRSETVGQLVLIDVDPTRRQVNRAIAGFLAGYTGTTLDAYRLDLRQWPTWIDAARLGMFDVKRAHIELYARWCESEGKAPVTIGRRLSTIRGFYNYCSEERPIDRNPAAHVRRPKQNSNRPGWGWIATRSARSWCRPGRPAVGITHWRVCWR